MTEPNLLTSEKNDSVEIEKNGSQYMHTVLV